MMGEPRRILVLKLGALGNIILSLGPFATIRHHHANARITLLTSGPFADWLARAPWFDRVWLDERPQWWDFSGFMRLRQKLIDGRFELAYDLQTSGRSSRYFQLIPHTSRPAWSGIAYGCALPDRDPNRNRMHDIDRQYGQLGQAGITGREPVDLSWSHADIAPFGLPQHFALLVPGSSAHRPKKRWPIQRYTELAAMLASCGLTTVVVGTAPERPLADAIPGAIDLTGRTNFSELTSVARAARVAVGNDTGPMHLFAAVGCPSVVLFSCESDPALCAPRGPTVRVLRRPQLAGLDAATVMAAAAAIVPAKTGAPAHG
jgi:ADP-heptose:LPS heptosyltransferase